MPETTVRDRALLLGGLGIKTKKMTERRRDAVLESEMVSHFVTIYMFSFKHKNYPYLFGVFTRFVTPLYLGSKD